MHTNQPDDLVDEMAELEDVIRRHTGQVVWLNAILLGGGLMMLSPGLLLAGLAGFWAVWAMRRHKLFWVGLALSIVLVGLTAHVVWATTAWTLTRWLDIGFVAITAAETIVATAAVVRITA